MNVRPGQKARVTLAGTADNALCGQENDGIVVMVDRLCAPGEENMCKIRNAGAVWHVTSISRPFTEFAVRQIGEYTICVPARQTWESTVPDKLLKPINDDPETPEQVERQEELTQ